MQKQCKCGKAMNIYLRTVIYQNKIEIENVPIFSCESCSHSEVFSEVKSELKVLIGSFAGKPDKHRVYFEEVSEIAQLLVMATEKKHEFDSAESIIEERINELLDLLLLAQSLHDEPWIQDIQGRLSKIAKHSPTAQDF